MTVLQYIEGPLTGEAWEDLCTKCYRIRYQSEHFTDIPAVHGGDAGIEGFTRTGVVFQCYCPEREYSDNDLYDHLRTKLTDDITKLITPKYAKRLYELGVPPIKEWHFVIPTYKDPRILVHAANKQREVLQKKSEKPQDYSYIDDSFSIIVKKAEDFKVEISKIIRTTLTDTQLNFAILHTSDLDWSKCDSTKVENIKRKVKAIMNGIDDSDEDYIEIVNMYVESYVKGIEILKTLRVSYTEIYEEIYMLEQTYKKEVSRRTRMNTDSSINAHLFEQILKDFENKIEQQFKYLTYASVIELKLDLVSSWLADCSMQFKR